MTEPIVSELVDRTSGNGLVSGIEFTKTGLVFNQDLPVESWLNLGEQLRYMEGAVHWWIGDLLNYGEQNYGEMYSQFLDGDGNGVYSYQTLNNDKWVSKRIEISRRREILSWSHHSEVAHLEPESQEQWLDLAVQEGLSTRELRQRIKQNKYLEQSKPQAEITTPAMIYQSHYSDWLDSQPDCDLLLTDPPYMTEFDDDDDELAFFDFVPDWLSLALKKIKRTGRVYICIGPYPLELQTYIEDIYNCSPPYLHLENVLVWTYRNTLGPSPKENYKLNWQAILYLRGVDSGELNCPIMLEQFSVQDISAPDGRHGNRFHTWQKPDELASRFIRHSTSPGDIVLDPFAGTGTFLVEASKLGRLAFGCDIDPEMIDLAVKRGCTLG